MFPCLVPVRLSCLRPFVALGGWVRLVSMTSPIRINLGINDRAQGERNSPCNQARCFLYKTSSVTPIFSSVKFIYTISQFHSQAQYVQAVCLAGHSFCKYGMNM